MYTPEDQEGVSKILIDIYITVFYFVCIGWLSSIDPFYMQEGRQDTQDLNSTLF